MQEENRPQTGPTAMPPTDEWGHAHTPGPSGEVLLDPTANRAYHDRARQGMQRAISAAENGDLRQMGQYQSVSHEGDRANRSIVHFTRTGGWKRSSKEPGDILHAIGNYYNMAEPTPGAGYRQGTGGYNAIRFRLAKSALITDHRTQEVIRECWYEEG